MHRNIHTRMHRYMQSCIDARAIPVKSAASVTLARVEASNLVKSTFSTSTVAPADELVLATSRAGFEHGYLNNSPYGIEPRFEIPKRKK